MAIEIFNAIAPRYGLANRVLSWGMDIGWRQRALSYLPPGHGLKVLDLATGTGDVAMLLAADGRVAEVLGIDPAEGMLGIAQARAARSPFASKIKFAAGDALALGFPDRSFDAVTVAFGLRNFADLMKGLMEAYRVIRPGGRLIVLEFSSPRWCVARWVHGFYLGVLVPLIGGLLTGQTAAYRYLAASARAFPSGERFCRIMAQAGFTGVECHELAWGAVAVYVGHAEAV